MASGFQFDQFDDEEDKPRRGGLFQRKRPAEPKVLFRVDHSLPFEDEDDVRDDFDQDEFSESRSERPSLRSGRDRPSRRYSVLAAIVILAAFGGFVLYSYFGDASEPGDQLGALPVLRADIESGKQRPEDPGGMEVPYQDRVVLNDLEEGSEGGRVERLLPPPESPNLPAGSESLTELPALGVSEKAETIEDLLTQDGMPAADSPAVPGDEAVVEEAQGVAENEEQQVATLAIKEAPKSVPEPEESGVAPAAGVENAFVVQLASVKEKGRIAVEWRKLQEKHPDLLGGKDYLIQEVKIENQGTFYRLQTGKFSSRGEADNLCADLKARSQHCIVVKR